MAAGKTLVPNQQALASDINTIGQWGLAADKPATGDVLAGSFYYETDTQLLKQEQNGSWINITGADLSTANAAESDVKSGKTFFSVVKPIKTGNIPTVALAPDSSAYPAGYHAGNVGGLPAIDADLITANIKSGKTIFNVAGAATVQDIADADLTIEEAPTGKKFYAVTGGVKTGTGTKTLDPANENVVAGYYAATTLSAVDPDLAVENIKNDVNIFGKVGTYISSVAEDVEGDVKSDILTNTYTGGYYKSWYVDQDEDYTLATKDLTYDAASLAFAAGFTCCQFQYVNRAKLRLYMGGLQMQESDFIDVPSLNYILRDFKALSGLQTCKLTVYNYGEMCYIYFYGRNIESQCPIGLAIGSMKPV